MKALKKILKIAAYVIAGIFLVTIIIAGFTQTKFFKDRLRVILVSELSTQLNGSLYLGTIRGNFITGFTIDSASIYSGTEHFLSSGKIIVRYDPFTLPRNILTIKSIILEKPFITIARKKGGDWNTAKLFRPSTDTTKGKLNWKIILENLELKNASVALSDSEAMSRPGHDDALPKEVEYHHFKLQDINIQLSAAIDENNFAATIKHISFYSAQPEFELTHFAGSFNISDKATIAKNVIIQTGHSYLEFDLKVKDLNIFNGIHLPEMRNDSTQLRFTAKNIDFAEFKSFLPDVSFLNGSALVDLDTQGPFGDLSIQRLNVQTYTTSLKLVGKLQNLNDPDNLYLDMLIGDSKIIASDPSKLMPPFNIPAFNELGKISFSAHYVGKPLNFTTTASLKGEFGMLEVDGSLNLEPSAPKYNFTYMTDKLNLNRVLNSLTMKTVLSSHGSISGEGFSLANLKSELKLDIDSAQFQNMTLNASSVHLTAVQHKFDGSVTLNSQNSNAEVNGSVDFSDNDMPSFDVRSTLTNFDFSKITGDPIYKTNITARTSLKGSGKTIDNLNGEATITLLPSSVHQYDWAPEEILLSLDQKDPLHKSLSVRSSIADADINGAFDIDMAAVTLSEQIDNLVQSVSRHISAGQMEITEPAKMTGTKQHHTRIERQLDFDYSLNVKNLEAVSNIFSKTQFNARGTLEGHIEGSDENIALSGKSTIDELFIGKYGEGALLHSGTISFDIRNLMTRQTLENLQGNVSIGIHSGISTISPFDSLKATLSLDHGENSFTFSSILDTLYTVSFTGKSSVQKDAFAIDLDKLTVQADSILWTNSDDVQLRINPDGIRIMHAALLHKEEYVSVTGVITDSGKFDLNAILQNISLSDINAYVKHPVGQPGKTSGFSGALTSNIHLGGTSVSPEITLTANGSDIVYRQSKLGNVASKFQYTDQLAAVDINVRPATSDSASALSITGILPINLAFSGVTNRFPDLEQRLSIRTQGFELGILEPLLVEFENLTGTLTSDLTITGTPRKPQYTGSLTIEDAHFLFAPNNIAYNVSGKLEPQGEKIRLTNFHIKNVVEDKVDGDATVEGTITLKNFKIDNFDLKLYGQLLFMSDASRKVIPTMYGTLFTAIDPEGLSLTGNLERPFLSGNLYVKDAELVFPPTKANANNGAAFNLNYIVIDDTTQVKVRQQIFSHQFYTDTLAAEDNSAEKRKTNEPSLIDRVRYDVNIETQGPTRIRMIFTPSTNEELYAELEGKVNALNNTGTPYIYGEISIASRSYYNFFKKFDATGNLKFVGQWDNPELDIKATYEGVRVQDTLNQKAIVTLDITGTRYEPKLVMGMKVQLEQGKDPVDWATQAKGGDVQSDAISFILTGKFRDDLTTKDREGIVSNVSSTSTSAVTGFTTTFLSGMLTDFLRKEFSFIRSAEVSYGGGNLQESADLRLSGEAFKGYWRFGGRIFNDISNANVSYQVSLGEVFNTSSIRNLFIELERRVEGSEFEERKLTNAARIYYRISF